MNEHDRRIMAEKSKPVKDRDALSAYSVSHHFCAACGSDRAHRHLHHIIGGRGGRSDEAVNLLSVCHEPCHPFCDQARNLGVVLAFKVRADGLTLPELARLAVLHGRTLPDVEPVPETFRILWTKNREGR